MSLERKSTLGLSSIEERPLAVPNKEDPMRITLARSMALTAILLLATPPTARAASSIHQRHCVARAIAQGTNEETLVHCYQTFDAAIGAATNGRVHLKNAAMSRAVSATELSGDVPQTTYVLSIDYQNANFGGSTFTWFQSAPCGSYQTSSMPSGWNDVISSVAAYSGCATTLYWNVNFGTPTYAIGVNGSSANLGTFNDKASSQKWCPVYPCS
jgi:hypothetical protein